MNRVILSLLLVAFTNISMANNTEIYSKALLAAFGNGCRSHGDLTTTSMTHSDSIISMIKAIQNDSQCKQWAQSLGSAVGTIDAYSSTSGAYKVDQLTQQLSNLQNALEIEKNPDIRAKLASKLGEIQVQLHVLGSGVDDRLWQNRAFAAGNFHQFSANLSATINSDARCVAKYPGLLMQIGGQVMNIVGNFNMWGNIAGLGLMGAGAVTDIAISAIRSTIFLKQMKRMETSKLTEGLICAFERVSQTYCSGKIVEQRTIQMAEGDYTEDNANWPGLQISRAIPIYNTWASLLVSGSPSNNTAISARKKIAIKMRENFNIAREYIYANFEEGKQLLTLIDDPDERESAIVEMLESIADEMKQFAESKKINPFRNAFRHFPSRGPLVYLFTGELKPEFQDTYERPYYFIRRTVGHTRPPSLDVIENRIENVIAKAQRYVESKLTLVNEVDPEFVLLKGEKGHPTDIHVMSPIDMLRTTQKYMKVLAYNYGDRIPAHISYAMQQTRNIVTKALEVYNEKLPEGSDGSFNHTIKAKAKLAKIQRLIAPEMKSKYISDRLKEIIDFELRTKLHDGDFPSKVTSLLRLTQAEHINALENYVDLDLNRMKMDARGAMRNSYENLDALANIFDWRLRGILKDLSKKKKKYPSVTAFADTLNMVCASLLSVPDLNGKFAWKTKIKKYCKGAKLKSVYTEGNIELSFDDYANKNFHDRVCAYDTYLLRNTYFHELRE